MHKISLDPTSLQMRARHCRDAADHIKDKTIRERLMLMAAEYETLATDRISQSQSIIVDELKQSGRR